MRRSISALVPRRMGSSAGKLGKLDGSSPVGVCLGPEGSAGLQLGVGVLREVRHHGQLVHVRVNHVLRLDQL